MKQFLDVIDVSKQGNEGFALVKTNFSQRRFEKIAVAGETGAGKSTVLKLIAGLLQADSGQLVFEGERITGPNEQLVPGHPRIAYLSQHFELQQSLRVEQVLAYSNTLSIRESDKLYAVCRIEHLLKRRTDQLSGGEKQRVAVCRLLISRPRLLLLDEPYAHLDSVHKAVLKSVVHDIGKKLRITCMLVSHDPRDTLSWADKILVIQDGRIVQQGTPQEIYASPVSEYVGGLFGSYNLIERESFRIFSGHAAIRQYIRKTGARKIFLRPEHLRLVSRSPRALAGKVEDILFFGGYQHLRVRISRKLFTLMTTRSNVRTGDSVYVAVSARGLHSLE